MRRQAILALVLMITAAGLSAADLDVDIRVETDQNTKSGIGITADGDVDSVIVMSAGGTLEANNYYYSSGNNSAGGAAASASNPSTTTNPDKIIANNYFSGNEKGVELYFNNVNWEDLPNNTLITTNTYSEFETRIESNQEAAIGALQRAFQDMAAYRNGETSNLDFVEYKMLESIMKLTTADINDFYKMKLTPEMDEIRSEIIQNRKAINEDRIKISSNNQLIDANTKSIQETTEKIQQMGVQLEAFDKTLKKMDADTYCTTLMEVMKEYGYPRVKCDLNSKFCYNGERFKFEEGRDYCVDIDAEERPPECYVKGTCGHVGTMMILDSEVDTFMPVVIDFINPADRERQPWIKVELYDNDGEELLCKKALGDAPPETTTRFIAYCDNKGVPAGEYKARITIETSGKEIIDDIEFQIYPRGVIERNAIIKSVIHDEAEVGETLHVDVIAINVGRLPSVFITTMEYTTPSGEKETKTEELYLKPNVETMLGFEIPIKEIEDYKLKITLDRADEHEETINVKAPKTNIVGQAIVYAPPNDPSAYLAGLLIIYLLIRLITAHKQERKTPIYYREYNPKPQNP
ncbi:hypothetical protein ACFLRF_00535 [Candidatus Altiarchaeota archaeon]